MVKVSGEMKTSFFAQVTAVKHVVLRLAQTGRDLPTRPDFSILEANKTINGKKFD